ncbi:polysaccharide lyase [Pontibacter arcticus]|uniref:Polysaccharide lyase n=1 Tax=Pontibacter arcticus TaxID=2080288 RepID=A0A364RCL9_9BACT|nr:polysaccharide lyase [Pontibacter arcticus]RAU82007.1 hypothetical protein DP923_15120 [Pontibacter arcticus]
MKRTQLLALSLLSFLTFSCEQEEAVQPDVVASTIDTEMSIQSEITSVDSYRRNLLTEERFEKHEGSSFIDGTYSPFYKVQAKRIHNFDATTAKARKGSRSAKFELRKSDSGVIRSESIGRQSETNRNRWYGLSMYLPSANWSTSNDWEIITQFWSQQDPGEPSHNPPIELFVSRGRLKLGVKWASARIHTDSNRDGEKKYDLGPVPKDKWVDFVYHINYSYKSDGVLEVWMDGKKVVDHRGPNSYNDAKVPYFKYGVYKRNWDSKTSKRLLYIDEVRVGNENATYNDVAPIRK